ncbi:MAG: long-chain acyl-CoA synthetase [Cyclobacteriaceae bacterium]|jgi:long-chain acyl-CoA synthetase
MDLNNLFVNLKKSENKIIFYDKGVKKNKKFSELYFDVSHAVSYLKRLNLNQGDRVGILGRNSYSWVVVDLACICSGYVTVPLESNFTDDLTKKIEEYDLNFVFTDNKSLCDNDKIISFTEVSGYKAPDSKPLDPVYFNDSDVFTFNFTSGTSGLPKAIETKKNSFDHLVRESQNIFQFKYDDRFLVFLPLNVYLERCYIYSAILIGYDIILINPEHVFSALQKEAPTVIIGVPYFFENAQRLFLSKVKSHFLLNSLFKFYNFLRKAGLGILVNNKFPIFTKLWGGNIRFLLCGSAPIKRSVLDFYDEMGMKIYEGYGMNEIGGMLTLNSPGNLKYGSVGKPFPGKEISFDEQGQIYVESLYHANNKYFSTGNDDRKCSTYIGQNRIATGDIGHIDDDGFIYITGRVKDLIVLSSGLKVHPAPIEDKIQNLDGIIDCCVYGDEKPYLTAVIVSGGEHNKTEQFNIEIAKLNERVPNEQRISNFFIGKETFSAENKMLTSAFKKNRKGIFKYYKEEFEKLYE